MEMSEKEDFFAKVAALAAIKNATLIPFICAQCKDNNMTSIDLGNLTTLPFSNLDNFEELSGYNSDYTPNVASQLPDLNLWKAFKQKDLHFFHLNVNSLLQKIDEVKLIANKSNATILGISETKLDKTILDNELLIEGYDLIRSDRNRHGEGVACYIMKERHYNVRGNCPPDLENIFIDLLLPNSRPILIGILYRPPDQSGFLGMVSSTIADMQDFDNQEVYILGDLNFNPFKNSKYILDKKNSK